MSNYCIHCLKSIPDSVNVCPICGKPQQVDVSSHLLKPGSILNNKYLVGMSLGEGGFGITYIGLDMMLERRVAIKEYYPYGYVNRNCTVSAMIYPTTNSSAIFDKGKSSFLKEAKTLAKFSDEPGIVGVIEFFAANNTAYIVMEFLDGVSLQTYVNRKKKLTPEETLKIMTPVMKSLSKVHESGLIHRDISPSNIMIVDNIVKLIDFGAARDANLDGKSLSAVLKPGYAPEEQYRSKGQQGPWTDVYALSATMYKCITGITPDEPFERMQNETLVRPSAMGIVIDPSFENAIMKGLSIYSKDRFRSMGEMYRNINNPSLHNSQQSAQRQNNYRPAPQQQPPAYYPPQIPHPSSNYSQPPAPRSANYSQQPTVPVQANVFPPVPARSYGQMPPQPAPAAYYGAAPKKNNTRPVILLSVLGILVVLIILFILIIISAGTGSSSSRSSSSSTTGTTAQNSSDSSKETDRAAIINDLFGSSFMSQSENSGITVQESSYSSSSDSSASEYISLTYDPYIADYTAPKTLGKYIDTGDFKINGKLYSLPMPLSELTENGWTESEGEDIDKLYLKAEKNGSITLVNGNQRIIADVYNYGKESRYLKYCTVETVLCFVNYESPSKENVVIPQGINTLMTDSELRSTLTSDNINYSKEESTFETDNNFHVYTIRWADDYTSENPTNYYEAVIITQIMDEDNCVVVAIKLDSSNYIPES